jgi:hypothetical protein
MLSPRRLRPWTRGLDRATMAEAQLLDTPPVARRHPHALLESERAEIVAAAKEVYCSESSVLRELRENSLVPGTSADPVWSGPVPSSTSPSPTGPAATTSPRCRPSPVPTTWCPFLDACSRKIVGRSFGPVRADAPPLLTGESRIHGNRLSSNPVPAAGSQRRLDAPSDVCSRSGPSWLPVVLDTERRQRRAIMQHARLATYGIKMGSFQDVAETAKTGMLPIPGAARLRPLRTGRPG